MSSNHKDGMRLPVALLALLLAACGGPRSPGGTDHEHEEAGAAHEAEEGPHGGRLLEDGDFTLEVTIFERGVPPEFRLYATRAGKPLPPDQVQARIALTRLDGLPGDSVEQHAFRAREDHLVSETSVREPHSFQVEVSATEGGRSHAWRYDSPEGRVQIGDSAAAAQGIQTRAVAGGTVAEQLTLFGRIVPRAERLRAVTARFPGLVQSVSVQVGDMVRAGQQLATVESNESLRTYPVTAPIAGTVVRREVSPGEAAGAAPMFEIADFTTVWAELTVFPRDRARLRAGQRVQVDAGDGGAQGAAVLGAVTTTGAGNAGLVVRAVIDNTDGRWTAGQFVEGRVTVAESPAALAVPVTALQRFRDWDVVALREGEQYQLQPVQLGRRDATQVEVLSGLSSGAQVVVSNSYLIKADVEKSGASHDH